LLNKFPDNKEIKTINYWQNAIPEVSGHNRKKLKVLDCPFVCEMNDNSQYIIDLGIQNYFYDGLDLNALTYGNSLRNASGLPVIIVVLLLKEIESNNSFEILPFEKYLNASEYKPIDDFVYVICFDLNYISDCIDSNIEPELNGFKISKVGKEWVKLLTIRTWMKKCYFKDKIKRYPIPKNLSNSEEVKSAIKILSAFDISKLESIVLKEKENEIIEENIKNRTIIEIWINAFLKGSTLDNLFIPFPEVAPEYLIKNCKNFLNKDNCKMFLNMLIKNKIIAPKRIYNDLINQIFE
jgi:NADPH-dependent 7-cyano-7-deazaguanine reductase QueF-like protein